MCGPVLAAPENCSFTVTNCVVNSPGEGDVTVSSFNASDDAHTFEYIKKQLQKVRMKIWRKIGFFNRCCVKPVDNPIDCYNQSLTVVQRECIQEAGEIWVTITQTIAIAVGAPVYQCPRNPP